MIFLNDGAASAAWHSGANHDLGRLEESFIVFWQSVTGVFTVFYCCAAMGGIFTPSCGLIFDFFSFVVVDSIDNFDGCRGPSHIAFFILFTRSVF